MAVAEGPDGVGIDCVYAGRLLSSGLERVLGLGVGIPDAAAAGNVAADNVQRG